MKHSINDYYLPAYLEGEGVGTAYEYFAKRRIIHKYIKGKTIRNILIVGLPEKYGYSMDFVILGDSISARITILEDRQAKIDKAKEIISELQSRKILSNNLNISFQKVDNFLNFKNAGIYDLVLTCETLQRIESPKDFVESYNKMSKIFIAFCPNGDNESHNTLSGLKSIPLSKLKKEVFQLIPVKEYGYIDFPPFPPGIKLSEEKRQNVNEGWLQGIAMRILGMYCRMEPLYPSFLKKRFAHIVYFVIIQPQRH